MAMTANATIQRYMIFDQEIFSAPHYIIAFQPSQKLPSRRFFNEQG